jgi:hypothetical protein
MIQRQTALVIIFRVLLYKDITRAELFCNESYNILKFFDIIYAIELAKDECCLVCSGVLTHSHVVHLFKKYNGKFCSNHT